MVAELGAQGTREAGQWVQATGESEERGKGGCAGRPSGLCGGNAPPPTTTKGLSASQGSTDFRRTSVHFAATAPPGGSS